MRSRRLAERCVDAVAFVWLLVEVPVFLARNRAIFRNELIYVFFMWSFGHSVTGIDYASRLYYPHRISLVQVPHPRTNICLPHCFEHNVDVFTYHSMLPDRPHRFDRLAFRILRFWVLLLSGLTFRFHAVDHNLDVYKTISVAKGNLSQGDPETDTLIPSFDYTGYLRLLRDGIGHAPALPDHLLAVCRSAIEDRHPSFFAKPFVTMLLREKGRGGNLGDAFRCCGPQENYVHAVEILTSAGYLVVGAGETRHELFEGIPGYLRLDTLPMPPELANLFVLLYANLFVGQQSGPLALANSRGVPCLITDALPHRLGTFRATDLILFKHLRERATGKRLSLVEVYRDHSDLAYGFGFDPRTIEIEPNDAVEIAEAAREMVLLHGGKLILTAEDEELCRRFRLLPQPDMAIAIQGNRTSIHALRQIREPLLALDLPGGQPVAHN